jgi:hypothetical protein
MKRAAGWLAAWALLAAAVVACGYSFQGTLPEDIKTVAVPVFKNSTYEPAVESVLTSAVLNAFATSGRLRVAPVGEADSLLEGEVTGYNVQALAFDRNSNVTQYRLLITMNVDFKDLRRGALLWRERGLQERADFQVPGQVVVTLGLEDVAVRQAAIVIARRVVSLALERF